MLDKEFIKSALDFYEVNDKNYERKCFECLKYINDNLEFKNRVFEIYNILYSKNDYLTAKLWKVKSKEELFGNYYHSYVTNILVLMAYSIHEQNMKLFNLDEQEIIIHKKRVKESLLNDVIKNELDGIRISQMVWASYFINLRIIEIGRLQYELVFNNPVTKKEDICIKIHIPSGEKLDIRKVKESIKMSKEKIYKYFKIKTPNYYCESWLLSKEVLSCVKDNSNISLFASLFNITNSYDCKLDILKYVFDVYENIYDYSILKEDTTLRKNLKKLLMSGKTIHIGIGKLKTQNIL